MAKNIWEISNFSGGLNAYADARDIEDTQFSQNWNVVVDRTGVLRVVGCALSDIDASFISNGNFQKGYGLFQFSSDYAFNYQVEPGFDSGIHRGTVSAVTGGSETTSFTLQTTANSYTSTDNYYQNMTIFFYSASNNAGQSRNIVSQSSNVITVSPAFTGNVTTNDKYIIVRWKSNYFSSSTTDSLSQDWLTDNATAGHPTSANAPSNLDVDDSSINLYYAMSKMTASDDQVNDVGGYIEYAGPSSKKITLKPGKEYPISFWCAFARQWQYFVAEGNGGENDNAAVSSSGIVVDEGSDVAAGSTSAINVDGSLGADLTAMQAKILNKLVYKSDGTFIGRCTAVAHSSSSDGTITFSGGTYTALANNITLYVGGEGEKVPWIELYSTTVTDGTNTGLYLNANNTWTSGTYTNASGNIVSTGNLTRLPDANCMLSTSGWTAMGSNALQPQYASTYQYGLHGTSLFLHGSESDNNYVYQNVELEINTKYSLSFVYKGSDGAKIKIWDVDNNINIVPWIHLHPTDGGPNVNSEEGTWSYFKDSSDNYLSFTTSTYPGESQKTVQFQIRLRDDDGNRPAYFDGFTLTKSHNDLRTMHVNNSTDAGSRGTVGQPHATTTQEVFGWNGVTEEYTLASPTSANVGSWNKYSTTFTVPEGYNEVDDWVLRIHSGRWGYENGSSNSCDDGASNSTQEVFIDNIEINGERDEIAGKDVITLLQSNVSATATSDNYTGISINSTSTNADSPTSFFDNYITFDGSAIPIFNYNKGVLRISDGNFSNSNDNQLLYYDNYMNNNPTWRKKTDGFLQDPPELIVGVFSDTVVDTSGNYNAIPHINELCEELTFESPVDNDGNPNPVETNWRYDQFGSSQNVRIGILTRFFTDWQFSIVDHINTLAPYNIPDDDCYVPAADTVIPEELPLSQKRFATQHGFVGVADIETGESHGGNYGDEQVAYGGGYVADWYSAALTPLVIPLRLSDNNMNNTPHEYVVSLNKDNTHVAEIQLDLTFEMRLVNCANILPESSGTNHSIKTIPTHIVPTFEIWAVVPMGENALLDADKVQAIINKVPNAENINGTFSQDDILYTSVIKGQDSAYAGVTIQQVIDNEDSYNYDNITIEHNLLCNLNKGLANIKFNIPHTVSLSTIYNDELFTPALGTGQDDGNSILIFVKENFSHTPNDVHNSVAGCLDSPIWDDRAQTASSGLNVTPNADWFEGTQYLTMFDNQLSEGAELDGYNYSSISYWTKYFVNRCDVVFRNPSESLEEFEELSPISSKQIGLELVFEDDPQTEASGWSGRVFDVAVSTVNIFDEESSLNVFNDKIGTFNIGESPDVTLRINNSDLEHNFIKTTKIYMKPNDTDVWYLQFYLEHDKGNGGEFYSTVSGTKNTGIVRDDRPNETEFRLTRNVVKDFNEVNSYESETFVSEKDALNKSNMTCRYKTSVVANNRLYVGNIKQNGKIYADRMIKSVDTKYGILPASNFIDVAINDGDEITALAFYKDKLLQFKRNKVFVINTSGDYEFLEDTFYNVGVLGQYSVIDTEYGICWANANGFYLYDGQQLTNLIENKIPTSVEVYGILNNRWCASAGSGNTPEGDCVVGYSPKKNIALINFSRSNLGPASTPTGALYHFPTNSWTMLFMVWNNDSTSTSTGIMSNMITNVEGDIIFYHTSSSGADITDGVNTIRKWEHDAVSTVHSTKLIYFTTKDITFGNINIRKKLYKVYITYRVATDGTDSGITVVGAVNGSGSGAAGSFPVGFLQTSKFAFGDSNSTGTQCYAGGHLDETDGKWKTAELIFDTPSEVNNITSFQLQFSGTTPYNFEINDISISYRIKSIK